LEERTNFGLVLIYKKETTISNNTIIIKYDNKIVK